MKRVLSAVKPTGRMTLGNYIGAIRQFVQLQDEYEMFIFIANEHAITIPIEAKELRQNTKDLIALYLAAGLDPAKATIFLQTDVPAHAQLGWVMTCMSYMGELQRMTQYKSKTANGETGITAGLFTYPCLMAADILLYDAEYVPVGIDQKQHVELTRNLAERFNHRYSDTFVLPEPLMTEVGQKIYSLQDPTKKMSKSEGNGKGTIELLDDPAAARKKIMSAVTDSLGIIQYDPENQPGLANLLTIQSCLTNEPIDSIVNRYQGKGYGELKKEIGQTVYDFLTDLQTKYKEIMASGQIDDILAQGAEKANYIANKKIRKVYKKVGFTISKK
ncbi:MAG: tryptophan--tRNA ligase [Absicoccus porci]|jgi:tryptophanyl-tRNA synthetase|uniref:Tryptophan--tRNA ligase n=1 Tax=Absicoccus porci TaxID=2486576 RepID=A0A3N0I3M0_9FIRM|nr:tryptophan--tRNA ligase [Absicoccus porci]MCI6087270.1 tryptophan--tRNA ligase [Absicoccus porci]MDD6460564.1 tryptophan--tRNA ligase [Absicoccus porci]MDD7329778.1 tryptophan--tRNA ligase [Absicoccus porci]MDY4738405.1 tryptophan--tRNA ligase [Absicoccus porci]MEE1354716.1 tryptophan--tRNA ligase [Absicoccus porci]